MSAGVEGGGRGPGGLSEITLGIEFVVADGVKVPGSSEFLFVLARVL